MMGIAIIFARRRFTQGPFGGAFDGIEYEHPLFLPWLSLTALLLFVFAATVWALWRGHHCQARKGAGFEVIVPAKDLREPRLGDSVR
jgi:hypothetical protein